MKNIAIELYADRVKREVHVWRDDSITAQSHTFPHGAKQNLTLNDGQHRVRIAVFNATLPLELVKELARFAIAANADCVGVKR